MDDVQWGDAVTLELIHKTILQNDLPNLHFLFSYRSDEIDANPGALRFVDTFRSMGGEGIYRIDLSALGEEDIRELCRHLFKTRSDQIDALSDLIAKKTLGNPFYIKALLSDLIEREEILYRRGTWHFEIEKIRSYGSNIDIASLMSSKLSLLTPQEEGGLQILSVLGSHFDLTMTQQLLRILKYPPSLMEGLEAKGFITLYHREYQFVHDMLQHYVLGSISSSLRQTIHRSIGDFLNRAHRAGRYDDVIGVVYHLNRGLNGGEWSKQVQTLNRKALQDLLLSGSYPLALEQLLWIESKGADEQKLTPSDRFEFTVLKVKIYYLNAMHEAARETLEEVMASARTPSQKLSAFSLFKNLCVTRGSGFEELVGFGNALLEELGRRVPKERGSLNCEVERLGEFIRTHRHTRDAESLLSLPTLSHRSKKQTIALLVEYWEAAYYLADIPLMQWSYLCIVESSLRFGNCSGSSFGYVLYGAQKVSEYRFEEGYRFGDAALKLNRLLGDETMLPKVHNFMANFISPYTRPLSHNIPLYQKSLHQSKINGDIVFGTWANFLMHLSDYLSGRSLESLKERIERESSFLIHSGDRKMIAVFDLLRASIRMWQEGEEISQNAERDALALWEEEKFYPGMAWYAILKAQTCWIEGEHEKGLEYLERYLLSEANEVIMFPKIRLHPLRALLLLGKSSALDDRERSLLAEDLRMCDRYASASPKEFKFWKLLIGVKKAKNVKHFWDVAKLYDEVLKEARKKNNPLYVAMAALCAARFWRGREFDDLSGFYLSEASVALNQWGAYDAAAKVKTAIRSTPRGALINESSSNSSLLRAEPTNYRSLLKSFYALSQSMEIHELLHTLMGTILENATASRGVLILKKEGRFYTVAQTRFEEGEIDLSTALLSETESLPLHLITHVIETAHKVVQNDPAHSGKFQADPYFRTRKPASAVAIPTLLEGEVKGVLYLENDQIQIPLDTDTLQTLRLLLTQAVIVYKNVLLYETLQKREEGLKNAQKMAHIGSWELDVQTNALEWSDEIFRIFEIDPEVFVPSYEAFLEAIHPEDRDRVSLCYDTSLMQRSLYEIDHRLLMRDGRVKWVREIAEHTYDVEGNPKRSRGTVQDITESKRTEEVISKLSEVVNQTPLTTIITDSQGVIEYVNAHTLKMTGYFSHELIGKKMNLFNSGVHPKPFYAELWTTIAKKRSFWRGVIINKMKNGNLRDCASTIFPIQDEEGKILNFVTIQDDVTERNMKDRLFLMQTRQAQMGEMLSMIAHQWRQPHQHDAQRGEYLFAQTDQPERNALHHLPRMQRHLRTDREHATLRSACSGEKKVQGDTLQALLPSADRRDQKCPDGRTLRPKTSRRAFDDARGVFCPRRRGRKRKGPFPR